MSTSGVILEERRRGYKKSTTAEEHRSKRSESQVTLRKVKRAESLLKRRSMMPAAETEEVANAAAVGKAGDKSGGPTIEASVAALPHIKSLFETYADNMGEHEEEIYEATRAVRRLLSRASNPPVEAVLEADLMPYLVKMLGYTQKGEIQFEAAWALTNIASTEYTAEVYKSGAVPLLVPLLMVANENLREQAAWCLGNIAGDNAEFRDTVLESGALNGLVANLRQPFSIEMKRNTMWVISNLCRGKPYPPAELVAPLVPVLAEIINIETDSEVLSDACWSLTYLSDGPDARIQVVVDSGLIGRVVDILRHYADQHNGNKVVSPGLRILGNILTGTDKQTQAVLDAGFLRVLAPLISHPKRAIVKEACWAASNVTAGTQAQIGSFLAMPGLPEAVVQALENEIFDIKKEAHWAIANICTNGSSEHVQCLVERYEVIPPLCELLEVDDERVIKLSIDALSAILMVDGERYGTIVDSCGGLETLDRLQDHNSNEVFTKANELIDNFFQEEDDDDDANVDASNPGFAPVMPLAPSNLSNNFGAPLGGENAPPAAAQADGVKQQFDFGTPAAAQPTERQLNFGSALQEKMVQ